MFKLITLEDIKANTKGNFGEAYDYLLDTIIIPHVTELLAEECNRTDFDKVTRTEFISPGYHQHCLFLKNPPVAPSPVIQLWQSTAIPRVYDSTTLLIKDTNYFVWDQEGMIEMAQLWRYFACGVQTVKVIYTGGYLTGDGVGVPPLLRSAAIYQAKMLFDRREELGASSRSLEGGSISLLPLILPLDIKKQLTKFWVPKYAS